jgi:hypothetical protein
MFSRLKYLYFLFAQKMPGSGCQICDVSLNSQEQLQQHRTGRKHLNKVKETGVGLAIHVGKL